jgi:hypothetical protein
MLVLQGTTPEETRNSIVDFLEQEAARYERGSRTMRLKLDRACETARANALLLAAHALKDAHLDDLKATRVGGV